MAITKAITGNVYKKKNSGTIFAGGNVSTSDPNGVITNNLTIRNSIPTGNLYGSQATDAYGSKAISAGPFANKLDVGNYMVRGLSPTIADQTSTILRSCSSDYGQKRISRPKTSDRRLHITSWDYVTGVATKGGSAGAAFTWNSDQASVGTLAIPGELTYMVTGLNPTNDDYKAKYL